MCSSKVLEHVFFRPRKEKEREHAKKAEDGLQSKIVEKKTEEIGKKKEEEGGGSREERDKKEKMMNEQTGEATSG